MKHNYLYILLVAALTITPGTTTHAQTPPNEQVNKLGKLLFFDKILSGNKNISCATCHHPMAALGDGLSLPVGAGGTGLGLTRETTSKDGQAIVDRVPRNAPHIFVLGNTEFTDLFHDGRVTIDSTQPSGFLSPAGENLPKGLNNVLAAQAMFPVTSGAEMAGQPGENPVADATAQNNLAGTEGVWELLANRLKNNVEYVQLFINAFDDINSADDITFVHAANAISEFEANAWRCDNTPLDQYFNTGSLDNVSPKVLRGGNLFYSKANCASCHSGTFLTDQKYHAIAMPQIGPGKGDGPDGHDDFGRERVTGEPEDRYKFRTPTLRQVAWTGPWGHNGAYNSLEAVVRHHLNPVESLNNYDSTQAVLISREDLDEKDFIAHTDISRRQAIANANELEPIELNDNEVSDLLEFLTVGLTDNSCIDLRRDIPKHLPSGLPVAD